MGEKTIFSDCSTIIYRRPLRKDYVPLLFKMNITLRQHIQTADRRLIKEVFKEK